MKLPAARPWVLAALLALGVLSWPQGAQARRSRAPKPPRVRPELDAKLPGHAKEFARVRVLLEEPADLSEIALAPDAIKVVVHVEGYPFGSAQAAGLTPARVPADQGRSGPAPFALLLIDDEASLRIDDAAGPLLLRGLRPGPHLLRVVLSRPWGEVVKAPGALALSRIWVGTRLEGPAGKAAERAVWPDPKKPLLTCVFPLPEERAGGPTLEAYPIGVVAAEGAESEPGARASAAPASAATPTSTGDSVTASATALVAAPVTDSVSAADSASAAAADAGSITDSVPAPASAHRAPQRPVLDFFLSGATLKPRGRGDKLRLVVDKKELPLVREWKPVALKLKPGAHRLTVDLLDRRGTKVRNSVNRTDRSFVLPESP